MATFYDAFLHPLGLNQAYMRNNGSFYVVTKITPHSFTAQFEEGFSKVINEGYNWLSRMSTQLTQEQVKGIIQNHQTSISVLEKALKEER